MSTTRDTLAPGVRNILNEVQAGDYLGIPPRTLRQWRYLGTGPRYVKVGRAVRYRLADLDAWLEAQAIDPQGAA